jgi:hypothetical protein
MLHERNLKNLKIPLFYGNCANVCPTDSGFFGLSRSNKSESVGQTLPQLPWKRKNGDYKKIDSFHQTS